jgi:hypothetical protein
MMNRIAVVSMGNIRGSNPDSTVYFPAGYPQGIIAVGATDNRDVYADYSHVGPHIDVSAPGSGVWGMRKDNDVYAYGSGTSFAAPLVSGLAASLLAVAPHLANDDVENLIRLGADDKDDPGFDVRTGAGRINMRKTLALLELPYRLFQLGELVGEYETGVGVGGPLYVDFMLPPKEGWDTGNWLVYLYEVRKQVVFPVTFDEVPEVWGRGAATIGYRNEVEVDFGKHYGYGYCEPVPGTITTSGCELRTYIYKTANLTGAPVWFPVEGHDARLEYTVLGKLTATDVAIDYSEQAAEARIQFSASTPNLDGATMSLMLPRKSLAKLVLWNVAGRRVLSLHDGLLPSGVHTFQWQGNDERGKRVASGMYFARLEADGQTYTKKIVLLR